MPILSQIFIGTRETLPQMREWLKGSLLKTHCYQHDAQTILIAAGEVLQNVIRYGFEANACEGEIKISLINMGIGLSISIEDNAPPSDPKGWSISKSADEGGHGLRVIQQSVSSYGFQPLPQGNLARLYFVAADWSLTGDDLRWSCHLLEAALMRRSLLDIAHGVKSRVSEAHQALFEKVVAAVLRHEQQSDYVPPFHNTEHFRDVLISVDYLSSQLALSALEKDALYFAALLHDYKHPGQGKAVEGYDSIEAYSASEAIALLASLGLSTNAELSCLASEIIAATEQDQVSKMAADFASGQDDSKKIQVFFNECDIAAAYLPNYGLVGAKRLFDEIGDNNKASDYKKLYGMFLDANRYYFFIPKYLLSRALLKK